MGHGAGTGTNQYKVTAWVQELTGYAMLTVSTSPHLGNVPFSDVFKFKNESEALNVLSEVKAIGSDITEDSEGKRVEFNINEAGIVQLHALFGKYGAYKVEEPKRTTTQKTSRSVETLLSGQGAGGSSDPDEICSVM